MIEVYYGREATKTLVGSILDKETEEKVKEKFPDAHVDVQVNGVDDREFFDEEKDIDLT